MWEPPKDLMAVRGFTIEDYLSPLEVKLVITSFLKGREQFTEEIANERIHVERMIHQLKVCIYLIE